MYSQCQGKNKQGNQCGRNWDLDGQGFCKFHRVGNAQCRGTTRLGAQCKRNWDLDHNGFCELHTKQFVEPRQCSGTTAKGTPCRTRFDLNEHGLCQYHQFQRLKRESQRWCVAIQCDGTRCKVSRDLDPVTKLCALHRTREVTSAWGDRKELERSSSTDPVLPPPVVPNPVRNAPTTAANTPTTTIAPSTSSAEAAKTEEAKTEEPKTEEPKTEEPKTEEAKTEETASSSESTTTATHQPPPLWTVEYIVSTRTTVIRMYSEYSRLCHHDPLLLKVSRWRKVSKTFVKCVAGMTQSVPVVGGFLAGFEESVLDRIDTADKRKKILTALKIDRGGLFHSDGTLDSMYNGLLKMLAKFALQQPPELEDKTLGSNLVRVENACLPIWVTKDERDTPGLEPMKRQPPLDPSVWFRFERVAGRLLDDSRGATIHWTLTKKGAVVETGAAAANEQVPVHKVTRSDLAQCALEVHVCKKRRWLKNLTTAKKTIDLANVGVSIDERNSGGNDGTDLKPTKLPLERGRVVHFRILVKP